MHTRSVCPASRRRAAQLPITDDRSTVSRSLNSPSEDRHGRIVTRDGRPHRVLGLYFTAGPGGALVQHSLPLEVDPEEIPRWYLVRTRPGREAVVERVLQDAGIRVLLPRLYFQAPRKKQRRRGRPKDTVPPGDRVEPLFPGYLFAQLAPYGPASWNRLRRAQGVEEVVGTGP
ncbi:MAG: hypothetical protein H5U04_08530 [Firmicutes bacterium]|nr:hypothetical protein [Bacillota bacterium]